MQVRHEKSKEHLRSFSHQYSIGDFFRVYDSERMKQFDREPLGRTVENSTTTFAIYMENYIFRLQENRIDIFRLSAIVFIEQFKVCTSMCAHCVKEQKNVRMTMRMKNNELHVY